MSPIPTKPGVAGKTPRGGPCPHAVTRTHDGPYVCGACGESFPSLDAVVAGSPVRRQRFESGATADITPTAETPFNEVSDETEPGKEEAA